MCLLLKTKIMKSMIFLNSLKMILLTFHQFIVNLKTSITEQRNYKTLNKIILIFIANKYILHHCQDLQFHLNKYTNCFINFLTLFKLNFNLKWLLYNLLIHFCYLILFINYQFIDIRGVRNFNMY